MLRVDVVEIDERPLDPRDPRDPRDPLRCTLSHLLFIEGKKSGCF
jgi:hypothetical protein